MCPDGSTEAADIVAADSWPDGDNTNGYTFDEDRDPGTDVVIARNKAGEDLVDAAIKSGHVTLGSPGTAVALDILPALQHAQEDGLLVSAQVDHGRRQGRAGHERLALEQAAAGLGD
ncbi:MAG: Coenzyme F420 hydrogenase/dehydrogenase, beta subunit C-terminal domain [Rhodospirillales bacterium]|nr:Coenzyme F420 hydrogenase/dehydrogenase, beta subunit C-terminal domain [Rhodospirillales bacterium]